MVGLQPTYTPAPPAQCPQLSKEPAPSPNFYQEAPDKYPSTDDIIVYLNAYGPAPLQTASEAMVLQRGGTESIQDWFRVLDLTNDGVPEIIMKIHLSLYRVPLMIFGCQDGSYRLLFEQTEFDGYMDTYEIVDIQDANRNGNPEILLITAWLTQGGHDYSIYEWNGVEFCLIISSSDENYPMEIFVSASGTVVFRDIDRDFVKEVVIQEGVPIWETYRSGLPWRDSTTIFKWDGIRYRFAYYEPAPPEYRFQAVQDGDYYTTLGEYDTAQALYQQVIFDPDLEWWSPERREYLQLAWDATTGGKPTPAPAISPDPDESPNLAAYARFRLMLLHLLRGWKPEAGIVYNELQAQFPAGTPGSDFAAMAAAFWQAYQGDGNLGAACSQAVAYIRAHPAGLTYLGSDYHGWQSDIYTPESVCPSR